MFAVLEYWCCSRRCIVCIRRWSWLVDIYMYVWWSFWVCCAVVDDESLVVLDTLAVGSMLCCGRLRKFVDACRGLWTVVDLWISVLTSYLVLMICFTLLVGLVLILMIYLILMVYLVPMVDFDFDDSLDPHG